MAGMVSRLDVDLTVTANGNTEPLDSSGMGQTSFTAEVSSISGSGAYIQVEMQVSNDAVNWDITHDTKRTTTTGFQTIPGCRISEKWYRYVWFVGGTSPSVALKITTTLKDYCPQRSGSLFRYDDINLKTGAAVSSTFKVFSCPESGVCIIRASDASTSATLKIQGSKDEVNWHDITGDFTIAAGESIVKDFSGNTDRFMRVIVVTAATGGTTATAHVLWNSTGGS